MTIINLEQRLRKVEAAHLRADDGIKDLSDGELAAALREASADPIDHAVAAWFLSGCATEIDAATLSAFIGSVQR